MNKLLLAAALLMAATPEAPALGRGRSVLYDSAAGRGLDAAVTLVNAPAQPVIASPMQGG
jgi:hypothetical protein